MLLAGEDDEGRLGLVALNHTAPGTNALVEGIPLKAGAEVCHVERVGNGARIR